MRAALVLAAGASRRFGRADKLLAPIDGIPLLLHALARAREAKVSRVYVVVSSARAARLLAPERGLILLRGRHGVPLSASLALGLSALRPIERELLVFLGDMPCAAPSPTLRLRSGERAVRPVWRDAPGHPLLVRTAVARAMVLRDDRGLGALRARPVRGRVGNVLDIDDRAALRRYRLGSRARASR